MNPSQQKRTIAQKKQLLKLHEMRLKTAESAYREKQQQQKSAQHDVDERKAAIAELKSQKKSVIGYTLQTDVYSQPELIKNADTRRFWLDYDLEKDEYYLEMDKDALAQAKDACSQAKQAWLKMRAREQSANHLLKQDQIALNHIRETIQELDNEELIKGGRIL